MALEKKKSAEAAQAALSNAQAEAINAKRKADELRQQAEEAELKAASAASMMSGQQATAAAPSAPAVPQTEANYTGYAVAPPPMGSMPDNKPVGEASGGMSNGHGMAMGGMGMQQQQQPQMYNQPPMAMMGGGAQMAGIPDPVPANGDDGGIPAPSTSQQDDYSNPFGGW